MTTDKKFQSRVWFLDALGILEDDLFVGSLHFGREVFCLPPTLWIRVYNTYEK